MSMYLLLVAVFVASVYGFPQYGGESNYVSGDVGNNYVTGDVGSNYEYYSSYTDTHQYNQNNAGPSYPYYQPAPGFLNGHDMSKHQLPAPKSAYEFCFKPVYKFYVRRSHTFISFCVQYAKNINRVPFYPKVPTTTTAFQTTTMPTTMSTTSVVSTSPTTTPVAFDVVDVNEFADLESITAVAGETTTPFAGETTTPFAGETTTPLAGETTTPLAGETTTTEDILV
uniref:Secreted protein n=1 Tax=Rhabditophanes sp. KR3021 TaxID=114890 RepID=A0AC35U943_9BILA